MLKILKMFFLTIFLINFSNICFSEEDFYSEGVKLFEKKNTKKLNFYLKEVSYLIPNIQIHIYIWQKYINITKTRETKRKI